MVTNIVVTVVLQKGKFVTMNEIKHEYVAEIQNAIWKAYKEVRETKSARGFNDTVQALENKYSEVSKLGMLQSIPRHRSSAMSRQKRPQLTPTARST